MGLFAKDSRSCIWDLSVLRNMNFHDSPLLLQPVFIVKVKDSSVQRYHIGQKCME